jgi:hypothetical protein
LALSLNLTFLSGVVLVPGAQEELVGPDLSAREGEGGIGRENLVHDGYDVVKEQAGVSREGGAHGRVQDVGGKGSRILRDRNFEDLVMKIKHIT